MNETKNRVANIKNLKHKRKHLFLIVKQTIFYIIEAVRNGGRKQSVEEKNKQKVRETQKKDNDSIYKSTIVILGYWMEKLYIVLLFT